MAQFDKIGKVNKDLITKEFLADKEDKQERRRIEFNGKSSTGTVVSFSAFQKLQDDSTEGSLKINRRLEKIDVDQEVEILPDNLKLKFTSTGRVDGLTVEVAAEGNPSDLPSLFEKKAAAAEGDAEAPAAEAPAAEAADAKNKFGASIALKYNRKVNDDVDVAGTVKASQEKKDGARLLELSGALSHSCGGTTGFLVKTPITDLKSFKELAFAAQFAEGNLTLNGQVKTERVVDKKTKAESLKTNATVGVVHKFNDRTQWGAEAKLPVKGEDAAEIRAVLQRNIGDERYKLRVAVPTGRVAGAFSTDFSAHSSLSITAEGDLRNVLSGKAADYKLSSKVAFNAE